MKIEDGKTAISYVASLDGVDKNRIGVLGVCNGGGFGLAVATYDQRVKAFASVAGPFDLRSQIANGKSGSEAILAGIVK